ncbi:Putative glycosyltransferase EpsD [Paenibacillus auburnensis]|uniref:Glycosyltransferase EpsD n=1 Tax=Paenibacillus auburnensis TaxID=2905649 RepID=A0ABN8GMQ2_9BACL|nr:glycosyltransferase family 4 protein [Paenibacillus auburnensis]CAH1211261.1 Putative glycosyltransferase EpsD [Paenibacillus auburnensis]
MKILYVTTISNTINAFLVPHIKMLIEQGHEVDIACNINKDIDSELLDFGCKVYNVPFHRSPFQKGNLIAMSMINKLVALGKYEMIHLHTPIASFFTRLACRKKKNLKILYTAHGFHFYKGAPIKNWIIYYPIELLASKWTDGIIVINDEDCLAAKKLRLRRKNAVFKTSGVGLDLDKYSIPSFEEKSKLRKEYDYKMNRFILFYAAELNDNKNQELLINAVYLLKEKYPDLLLLLAGEGPLRDKLEQKILDLGLSDNVTLLGYRNDISQLLKISDIAVASSKREGLPVNIMEAMATGLPLIATDCRGQRDLITNSRNGYIISLKDIKGFAEAIVKVRESKTLRDDFSKNNLIDVNKYSLINVMLEMNRIYEPLTEKMNVVNINITF